MKDVVILGAMRTPIASFQGSLKDLPAPKLGAAAIQAAVQKSGVPVTEIDECLMGNVLTAGIGQAPARQAAIFGGLPKSVRATTINRVCGSGIKTLMLGSQMIQTGDVEVVVAGGMESMTNAPYLLPQARQGYRMGPGKVVDSLVHDGLWDAYGNVHMGSCAELCSKEKNISREEQDRYAKQSYTRALAAVQSGKFRDEIVPVPVKVGKEDKLFDTDEEPSKGKLDKFGELKPVFQKDGTVTAANASSLSDGAAALVLASSDYAASHGLKPLGRIIAQASFAQEPEWFTTAPIGAIQNLMKKSGFSKDAIDLYEINEAFSVVALACVQGLGIPEEKVNIYGGAVALGHPIGASGSRIVVTLLHALRREKKRYGVAALCIGGGEGSSILVEAF